jgi:hypothetical protein
MENPLFRASAKVQHDLIADGNTFTNDTALRELPKDAPFIVLRCIRSGDGLEHNQAQGCGSLIDYTKEATTRKLRPQLRLLLTAANKTK